jgi:hypothetical protein
MRSLGGTLVAAVAVLRSKQVDSEIPSPALVTLHPNCDRKSRRVTIWRALPITETPLLVGGWREKKSLPFAQMMNFTKEAGVAGAVATILHTLLADQTPPLVQSRPA